MLPRRKIVCDDVGKDVDLKSVWELERNEELEVWGKIDD